MRTIIEPPPLFLQKPKVAEPKPLSFETKRLSMMFMPGMFWNSSQGELLNTYLRGMGISNFSIPVSVDNAFCAITLKKYVADKVQKINETGEEVILLGHSYGHHAAVMTASQTQLVKGVVSLAPGAHRGIWVKPEPRIMSWAGIKACVSGEPFRIPEKFLEFVLDGGKCKLGMASGKVLRRATFPYLLGYKVPMMKTLLCRTHIIVLRDDKLVPFSSSKRIIEEHGPEGVTTLPGGHFGHCDPNYCWNIANTIHGILKSWNFALN